MSEKVKVVVTVLDVEGLRLVHCEEFTKEWSWIISEDGTGNKVRTFQYEPLEKKGRRRKLG